MFPKRTNESLENWDLFVLRHQDRSNVMIHFISFLMFWLGPALGILVSPYFWILFFTSGMMGVAGHYFFNDGTVDRKEATSSFEVVAFSSIMAVLFLKGSYGDEIERVKQKYHRYIIGKIPSHADVDLFKKLGQRV